MAKTNTRAIAKILEAHKVLKKLGRSSDTAAGQAFALDLVQLLEKGKPMTVTIGNEAPKMFRPDDVRVSRTKVMLGKIEIGMMSLTGGTDGAYEVRGFEDDNHGEAYEVRIAQAEMAPA